MVKKRLIVSYQNLSEEVLDALNNKYPDGFENHVIKVDKGNNNFFYGVTVDHEETSYLVKVDVSIDSGFDGLDEDEDERGSTPHNNEDLLAGIAGDASAEEDANEAMDEISEEELDEIAEEDIDDEEDDYTMNDEIGNDDYSADEDEI